MGAQQVFEPSHILPSGEDPGVDTPPLIVTKIRVPQRRRDLLPRGRLVDFIHTHLDRKLILISAPAGYGKTSLLTDFAEDTDLPVCWYTLDPFDRDLHAFLEHLIAAIALRFPTFGQRSRAFLRQAADPGANLYLLVATMVQEIYDSIPEYFLLVLDDHHNVEDQEQISEFLDLFVTYADENCHLVIASRTLPTLPNLSLLVARRQAAGLSIDELRFTPQEILALARQNYRRELSVEQATQLAERTGGWITGILLTTAHRWEQAGDEVVVHGRINVDVYDYLSQQVLDRQPDPLRSFLLASSVLDELSPELCAAVLEIDRPAGLMDQVRMRNLFVTEFEGEQNRLRYHDLFREFLQETLRRRDEAEFLRLTLRAARAYAERGEWERAVSRYLLVKEYGPVVDIVNNTASGLFDTGRWDTLVGWLDALPESARITHPNLLIVRGKIHMERGEHDLALALYDQAEQLQHAAGDEAGRAYALAMKGYVLRFQGRYFEALARSCEALEWISGTTVKEQAAMALAYRNAGLCHFQQGQPTEGRTALQEALRLYEALDATYDVGMIHHDLGFTCELTGDLDGAAEHYQAALHRWQELGIPGPWAMTLNSLGVIYCLQGRYEEAARTLDEALIKARKAGDLRVEAYVWASLGDLHQDLGAHVRARQAYQQALEVAERSRSGFIQVYGMNGLGDIARLQGDLALARKQLQKAMELARQHGSSYEMGLCHMSLGMLAAQNWDLASALEHLDQSVEAFESGSFVRELAVACLRRAHVALLTDNQNRTQSDLERALELASRLAFDQFLVAAGQQLPALFQFAQEQAIGGGMLPALLERIEAHRALVEARPEPSIQTESPQALKIYGLGQPRVTLDGQAIQWTTSQSRDLFFFLVQHPKGLRKEEIGSIFWPDHPPQKLDGIFRSTLYRLRRAIFRESVLYIDGVYAINWETDYWFDVATFEALLHKAGQEAAPDQQRALLEAALALYRGDYLDGIYADWCTFERERLRERYLDGRETLAELHAVRGDLQRAIEQYQQVVVQDPYREPAHRELMRCHYRLGDRVAAIRQYLSCVEILREDLGLSPAPETEALYLQIIG